MKVGDQRGGIITGFLLRSAILFVLLGLCVYEAGAIIVTKVTVEGVAMDAAKEAAVGYRSSEGSRTKAKRECDRLARRSDAICVSVRVERGTIVARVRKEAPTLIAHRIGPIAAHTSAVAERRSQIP